MKIIGNDQEEIHRLFQQKNERRRPTTKFVQLNNLLTSPFFLLDNSIETITDLIHHQIV